MAVVGLRWAHLAADERRPRGLPWQPVRISASRLVAVVGSLLMAFVFSGTVSLALEGPLYTAAFNGAPISLAMHRALQVLLGHLVWVACGAGVLFVALDNFWSNRSWFRLRWQDDWLWWVVGGYFASSFAFNCADALNQFIVPDCLFDDETIVTQMINPENNDLLALATGAIAPCLTAPFWEETLYRGFLLPVRIWYQS